MTVTVTGRARRARRRAERNTASMGSGGKDDGKKDKGPSIVERLRHRYAWLDHAVRAGKRYTDNNGDHYAAAVTYFSVLALFPLVMVAFSILGFVLFNNQTLIDDLKIEIAAAVPGSLDELIVPLVDTAVENRATVGIIGLVGSMYSGLGWIGNLREALTAQWEQKHDNGAFLKTKVRDAGALLGLGLALIISLGLTAAGTGFTDALLDLAGLDDVWWARAIVVVLTVTVALFGNWLVFMWVIARLPRQPVTLRSAAKAAVMGAVGFEILKVVATLFLSNLSGTAGKAFGPIIGLLVFVFLVSRFLLFVTAWAATAVENERQIVAPPVGGATIQPIVTVRSGPDSRVGVGLVGAGAVFGLGLGWLLRRK